ncbi:MAG TPA: endonuclease/exonuclease/phosphatase family protein, partial [Myxococcota bacterium]|nr:endonuclease/exonuclease/phosphatase family protein [Myxococcota bacterium]
ARADGGLGASDAAADAGGASPDTFTLVAWNVEQFPMTPSTVDAVAALIMQMDADLYGIEEIADTTAFAVLLSRLPGYDGMYAAQGDGFTRVGMIWKTARVQVGDAELLFANDSWAFPRPPLKAVVTAAGPTGGVFDFVFVVVHLKAQPDDESRMRRALAVQALEEYVGTELSLGTEDDFVIAGDWNDALTDAPIDNVFLPFLDSPEAYVFLDLPLEESGTLGTYIPFSSFIDHILVTSGALDEYGPAGMPGIVTLDATFAGYTSIVSDHRPVRAVFSTPF